MPEHSGRGRKTKDVRKKRAKQRRKQPPTRKNKVSKKAMIKSRQPLVETKQRIQSEITTGETPTPQIPQCKEFTNISGVFHNLPLSAFWNMSQGVGEDSMLGQSIFSRYLNAKVQIRFPGGANAITDRHYPMELVCGWIPSSIHATTFTTPKVDAVLPADINTYIVKAVSEYFNARTDRLDFIPKHASTIRITYRKRIVSNQAKHNTLTLQSDYGATEGLIPDVMLYPKWNMNKKVYYEQGANVIRFGGSSNNYYPNYSWIPFMVVYSPMFAGEAGDTPLPVEKQPRVSYNVAHYFTDS